MADSAIDQAEGDDKPWALTYWSDGMLCYGCSADGYATATSEADARRRAASHAHLKAEAIPYSQVPERLQLPEFRG